MEMTADAMYEAARGTEGALPEAFRRSAAAPVMVMGRQPDVAPAPEVL